MCAITRECLKIVICGNTGTQMTTNHCGLTALVCGLPRAVLTRSIQSMGHRLSHELPAVTQTLSHSDAVFPNTALYLSLTCPLADHAKYF